VEVALGLPTAQLVTGARERGLARLAFRDRIPEAILERRTKGEMSAVYGQMVARNLDLLRPFLLEGRLARAGLLDRAAFETALTYDSLVWQGTYGTIMATATIEGWVRHWGERLSPDRASAVPQESPPASA
jgi:asparagine synthase (glutamine-hydrolysing)